MEVAWAAVVGKSSCCVCGTVVTPGQVVLEPVPLSRALSGQTSVLVSAPMTALWAPLPLLGLEVAGDTSPLAGTVSYGLSLRASKTQRAGVLCHSRGRAIAWMPSVGRGP